ncbi:MAG: beta-lactamase family protein [Planctomycetes bacterium]|nr:beta-lactamase family protein [Planctomycetota bacterium]
MHQKHVIVLAILMAVSVPIIAQQPSAQPDPGAVGVTVGRSWSLSVPFTGMVAQLPDRRAFCGAATDLAALFGRLHRKDHFSGNVLVAERGRVIFERSFGLADDATQRPLDARSVFPVASITKPICALAVLQMRHEGLLALDAPARTYLPEFPYPTVTLRHLLTHTSGLVRLSDLMDEHWDAARVADDAAVLAILTRAKPALHSTPGQRFEYENLNYVVLGQVVGRVAGMSFSRALKQRIFEPLVMTATAVDTTRWTEGRRLDRAAEGYVRDPRTKTWVLPESLEDWGFLRTLGGIAGDGGVVSTARDLLILDRALRDHALVSEATWNEAISPTCNENDTEIWNTSWVKSSYGLGWYIGEDLATTWHNGDWGGHQAGLRRYLDSGKTGIYLSNRRRLVLARRTGRHHATTRASPVESQKQARRRQPRNLLAGP